MHPIITCNACLLLPAPAAKLAATGEAVPVGDVAPGTEVLVPPGESVPLDGTVLAGESAVEESLLTGAGLFGQRRWEREQHSASEIALRWSAGWLVSG